MSTIAHWSIQKKNNGGNIVGWYKLYQFKADIQYWYSNLSDVDCIRGVLKFYQEIKKDAFANSKEALCLLIDLNIIIKSLKLNDSDKKILKCFMWGCSNIDEFGYYHSDEEMLALDLGLDKKYIKRRLNKIIENIKDYNDYLWMKTNSLKYKEWILKSKDEKDKIMHNGVVCSLVTYIERNTKIIKTKVKKNEKNDMHKPVREGYIYERLFELRELKKKLQIKHEAYKESESQKAKQYVKIMIDIDKEISYVKRCIGIKVRRKKPQLYTGNEGSSIWRNSPSIDIVDEFKEFFDKVDTGFQDKFLAWKISIFINERLSERQKKIFWIYYIQGLKQQEISDKTGIEQGHISRDLKTIRSKIRGSIEPK